MNSMLITTRSFSRSARFLGVLALVLAGSAPAAAELELPRPSPRATVSHRVGLTDVTVEYSSPSVRGRTIWGELVPYGTLWRAGANACTKLSFSQDVTVSEKPLPAGNYCLFIIPNEDRFTVVINKNSTLSGTDGYSQEKDALRVEVTPETIPARENLTYLFTAVDEDSANLRLEWDTRGIDIPFSTDTEKLVMENIRSLESDQWREYADAARFLVEKKQELPLALSLVEKSLELEKTWFNSWVKAQVLAAQGKKDEAVEAAEAAKALGDDSGFFKFYAPQIDKALAEWS